MSESIRNLANRYTLDSYPYMDNPSTQARWNELGDGFTNLVETAKKAVDTPTGQAVMEQAAQTDIGKKLLPQKEEPKKSWLEENKQLVFGVVAGLGLLYVLKNR